MRNLKRALSLLLSSTMVLGMVVMGGSAAGYQDVDASNDNQEAIEVLQAVGIMSGVDDKGNFDPDGSITRNEMAVVMAHLLNLDYDYYRGTNTFTDVPEWAAPYVAACVAEGVTAGVGNGLYGGDQKITAAQAGLMVMKALGYFQNQEDFGDDWQIATIRQASYINLFDKVNSNAESALTRGQVAQLVLNGLKSNMVTFTGDKGVQIGDVSVGYHAEYTPVTNAASKYNSIVTGTTTIIGDNGQYYVQLGEELYNGDLKLQNGSDDFMRPSRVWSYKGTEIGTYAKKELMVKSYTAGVTGKTMYDLLSSATNNDYDLYDYVDGTDNTIEKTDLARSNNENLDATGNGVLTEVYVDNNAKEITIVSINTWLAQATGDYNESKEYAPLKVFTAKDGKTTPYNVDVEDVSEVSDVTDGSFYLVNISKKDVSTGEIVAISDAEVMENSAVTKWSKSSSNVVSKLTVDGTEYNAAVKAFYDDDTLEDYDLSLLTDMTYNIYKDQYGYVIGVSVYEGTMKYVFITGYDRPKSNLSVSTATAGAIFLDGTMEEIKVNVKDTNTNIKASTKDYAGADAQWTYNGTDDGNAILNRWYTYTVNEDGVYTLKPADMVISKEAAAKTVNTANVSVQDNVDAAPTRVYGEDNSTFITVDTDVVDTNSKYEAITDVTGVYTGVQDVDLEFDPADFVRTVEGHVYAVYDKDYYIIGAIALADAAGSTANYAYILSDAKSEAIEGDTYYWTFDAIVGGEIQTLTAKSKYTDIFSTINANKYDVLELRFDSDNYVIKAVEPAASDIYTDYTGAQDLDDYSVYAILDGATYQANQLTLQGRTLRVTSNLADEGLALAANAKAVVIQDENGKADVKTEFDSVEAALSHLADPNKDTAALEYDGDVVAILNSNGNAAWVVFKSNTELKTGTEQGGSGSGSGKLYSYNVWTDSFGFVYATVTYDRPDYVPANDNVNISFDVYANGKLVATQATTSMGAGIDTYSYGGFMTGVAVGANANLELRNVTLTPSNVYVKYVDDKGNDVSLDSTGTNPATLSTSGTPALKFALDDAVYNAGTYNYTVTGLTTNVASTSSSTLGSDVTASNVAAKGDDYVTVTFTGLVEKPATYKITAGSGLTAAQAGVVDRYNTSTSADVAGVAAAINGLGVGANNETATLLVEFQDGAGSDLTSGITKGDSVNMKVTIGGSLAAAALKVDITVSGTKHSFDFTTATTEDVWIPVNGNLTVDSIKVSAVEKLAIDETATAKGLSADGRTLTITFNGNVSKSGSAIDASDFTVTAGTSNAAITNVKVNGDVVTLTFSTALKNGETVQVKNTVKGPAGDALAGNDTITVVESSGNYSDCTFS